MTRAGRVLLVCAAVLAAAPASAEETTDQQAQRLFDEAMTLMKAGKFAEACPKLLQSGKLDPGMGTKYRLAECYEGAGLVGSAFALFTEVAGEAAYSGRTDRQAQARARAAAL